MWKMIIWKDGQLFCEENFINVCSLYVNFFEFLFVNFEVVWFRDFEDINEVMWEVLIDVVKVLNGRFDWSFEIKVFMVCL